MLLNRRLKECLCLFYLEMVRFWVKAFIGLMTKLTNQNLTEAEPSHWAKLLFYDHPPYNDRVKLAHNYICKCERSKAI